jgi:hypothetical protein
MVAIGLKWRSFGRAQAQVWRARSVGKPICQRQMRRIISEPGLRPLPNQ